MSISITYPNLHSILLLIAEEYDDLFKIQKEFHDNEMTQIKKQNEDKINKLKKAEESMRIRSNELD